MQALIQQAAKLIKSGETIIYPTDTVIGLGCDATNIDAVKKLYTIKKRAISKSFLILLYSENQLPNYVKQVPKTARDILSNAPQPTTLIFPNVINLPKTLLADDGSIGIRIVKKGFAHELLKKTDVPLVSTSANIAGLPTPQTIKQIAPELLKKVDFVVDLPNQSTGKASRIVKIGSKGDITIIRP